LGDETMTDDTKQVKPRWARRVRQEVVRRLYESDARGLRDEELVDEVGIALYARCHSMIEASEAREGKARCPSCEAVVTHDGQDETVLTCAQCGWQLTWLDYRKTLRNKKLAAPGILGPLRDFAGRYPQCRRYMDKLLAIDKLIHTFHAQSRKWPTSPIAKNVIEGNIREIVEFLDNLAYGDGSTPGLLTTRESYRKTLARSWAGGAQRPKDWREPVGDADAEPEN
jgi:ribosomal protein L37AE/L43A